MDNRTFKVNFTGEGAERLRVAVKEKLKEFMGDYTDDTLVEYVIVLLRNGRRKEEARNELDVFLGDDSSSFISWLWDHLAASLELYVKPHESDGNVLTKLKPLIADQAANVGSSSMGVQKGGKSGTPSRSRHDREWKDLVGDAGEPPHLQSTQIENIPEDEEAHLWDRRTKRSFSPQYYQENKRKRTDERPHAKREPTSKVIDAPRRLLQFAVRDAVAMSRTSESAVGQPPKRLRSVLSTISSDDHSQKVQSIARVRNPMSTVIKAVAEAAQDVRRVRPSGNVFDRLSCALDIPASHVPDHNYPTNTRPAGYGDFNEVPQQTHLQKHEHSQRYVDVMVLEDESNLMYDDASVHEDFDDPNIIGHSDISQVNTLDGSRGENLRTILGNNSMSEDANNGMKSKRHKYLQPPNTESSLKKEYVKAKVPKQSHGKILKQIHGEPSLKHLRENSAGANKEVTEVEASKHGVINGNGTFSSNSEETKKLLPPTSGSVFAVHSSEDSDSRTIFVSNVHSTATKDNLYQHFNKFGELIKIVINTDATTGQPIGSAVIEFTHKDAADNALALNGTTFLSRTIKVVKRSSSLQQAPLMAWPRVVRASPYARSSWVPYGRGILAPFRSRPPIRLGARSLQWKRDSQVTSAESTGCVSSPMSAARKFTYVRTEPKPGNSVGSS